METFYAQQPTDSAAPPKGSNANALPEIPPQSKLSGGHKNGKKHGQPQSQQNAVMNDEQDYVYSKATIDPISELSQKWSEFGQNIRHWVHEHSPAWVLNHSNRLIATNLLLGDYFVMLSSKVLKQEVKWHETETLPSIHVSLQPDKFANRFRMAAASTSAAVTLAGILFNAEPQNKDEKQTMARLYEQAPWGYASIRTGQMFAPWIHFRQTLGLAMMAIGGLSMCAGLTQKGPVTHKRWGEFFGAGITSASGAALAYSVDDEIGWQRFGTWMPLRLPFSVWGSYEAWTKNHDPWYATSVATFSGMNTLSYLIGGVKKDEYGHLIYTKPEGMTAHPHYSYHVPDTPLQVARRTRIDIKNDQKTIEGASKATNNGTPDAKDIKISKDQAIAQNTLIRMDAELPSTHIEQAAIESRLGQPLTLQQA